MNPPPGPFPTARRLALEPADSGSRALHDALRSTLRILKFIMACVTAAVLFSGVFIVEPNEIAVVLRFGKAPPPGPNRILGPGLHWALPYPIDEIVRIPTGSSHTVLSSTAWFTLSPEQIARGEDPPPRGVLTPGADGYLLSADGNIFHARATLKYRIHDPVQYAFHFRHVTNALRSLLNNALIHAAARFTADAALYRDKPGFRDAVLAELNQSLDLLQPGITLDPLDVQAVAPVDVRPAFESVLAAEQERSQKINEASAIARETTLKADAHAHALVGEGRADAHQLHLSVASEARFFSNQLAHYRKNPALFRRRWIADSLQTVLTNAQDTFLLPKANATSPHQVRLQLNREPAPRKSMP